MGASSLSSQDRLLLDLARRQGVLRSRDLQSVGVARTYLGRLRDRGLLVSLGQGLYMAAEAEPSEHQSLIEVARRVPSSVICLLSALRFHEIGTQEPPAVWVALSPGARTPRLSYPRLEVVRVNGSSWWQTGSVWYDLRVGEAQVPVRITTPAQTVADCFKFRSRVGLDVALEALSEVVAHKRVTVDELWQSAQVARVTSVLRPYLEAMLAR